MLATDVVRYGLRYALIYVGMLGLLIVGGTVISTFYEFRPPDLSIGALIAAAMLTSLRFLENKVRLPTTREYWTLVATGSIIVLAFDFTLAAVVIHFTRGYSLDRTEFLIIIGIPLFKGVLGNMLFFRRGGFSKRTLKQIEAKQSQLEPSVVKPSNKMTLADTGPFLVRYFSVYIPLYVVTRYVSINSYTRGEL